MIPIMPSICPNPISNTLNRSRREWVPLLPSDWLPANGRHRPISWWWNIKHALYKRFGSPGDGGPVAQLIGHTHRVAGTIIGPIIRRPVLLGTNMFVYIHNAKYHVGWTNTIQDQCKYQIMTIPDNDKENGTLNLEVYNICVTLVVSFCWFVHPCIILYARCVC